MSVSLTRAKCYLILQGLERSLADNLTRLFDINLPEFLSEEQKSKARKRLQTDSRTGYGFENWGVENVSNEELLGYLDLADLAHLLNRNRPRVSSSVIGEEIRNVVHRIEELSLYAVRNRVMHAVRPLNPEDYPNLVEAASALPLRAPSLNWELLVEGVAVHNSSEGALDVKIPSFWEEQTIPHNLPGAEFDDTGFIGRDNERHQLKDWIKSDNHRVITIVGAGGMGKTALALRVCHDVIEDPSSEVDRVVWVSLKTQYLTPDGIREISDAVSNLQDLQREVGSSLADLQGLSVPGSNSSGWDSVLQALADNRILLVIDNLETLGTDIRDLAVEIPRASTLLLTSRIGLGEIEVRYPIPDFSPSDAEKLMRTLSKEYNYTSISTLSRDELMGYCENLLYNPLLIKQFVQTVGRGTQPSEFLSHHDQGGLDEALRFSWDNVYQSLSPQSKEIISYLLSARRDLSRAQIQELMSIDYFAFQEARTELQKCNMIEITQSDTYGASAYRIGNFVFGYLSRNHPPDNKHVRETIRQSRAWQAERDRYTVLENNYRYGQMVVHANSDNDDEVIAARHLREALEAISRYLNGPNSSNIKYATAAEVSLTKAEELLPTWWEVHRVKALLYESIQGRQIFDILNAYEESIAYKRDSDVNRYFYAAYLARTDQYDRALEQVDIALQCSDVEELSCRSLKGLCLARLGRFDESSDEHDYVWTYRDDENPRTALIHGTRYADALRRRVEQFKVDGDYSRAWEVASRCFDIVDEVARACRWDKKVDYRWDEKLVRVGLQLVMEILTMPDMEIPIKRTLLERASRWDKSPEFIEKCRGSRIRYRFGLESELQKAMPNSWMSRMPSTQRYQGVVFNIFPRRGRPYGFIETDSLDQRVYMNPSSLRDRNAWELLSINQSVSFSVEDTLQ